MTRFSESTQQTPHDNLVEKPDGPVRNVSATLAGVREWNMVKSMVTQFVRIRRTIAISLLVGTAGVSTAFVVSLVTGTPPDELTRDPTSVIEGAHFYTGALSTVGLLLWAAATAVCLFGAVFLARNGGSRRSTRFLFWSGLLSLMLTLDDALLIHERLFPWGFNIPEQAVFAAYGLFLLVYLKSFHGDLLQGDCLLLGLAGFFLAASLGIDQFVKIGRIGIFVDDCFKFFGVVFWLAFFVHTTFYTLRSSLITGHSSEATAIG
jgi:hypothetical protein